MSDEAPSSPSFDLLHKPWISCMQVDGGSCELGVLEVLRRAHQLREIIDSSPLVVVATVRLLEAVLLQSLPLKDEDDWVAQWARGRFSDSVGERVEAACGARMDLFDAQHPFFQSSDIDASGSGETTKSVGYLFPEVATGTAVTHYAHGGEDRHAFCEACCAKGLVCLPAFATPVGRSIKPSINGVPPTYVLPMGGTLFASLLLNYLLPDWRPTTASQPDPGPFWASDGIVAHKDERVSAGFLESLTWQPRRVRLLGWGRSGTCSRCGRQSEQLTERVVLMQGRSRSALALPWRDPWAALIWRKDKAGTVTSRPLRPSRERATWRDTGALFLASAALEVVADARPSRPSVVDQLETLLHEARLEGLSAESPVHFLTVGIRTEKMGKVLEWRSDRFDFPGLVLAAHVASPVAHALSYAESAADALGHALLHLHAAAERERPPWPDIRTAMRDLVRLAQGRFWRGAEPLFRSRLFDERLAGSEQQQADWLSDWRKEIRLLAGEVLEGILAAQDDCAGALRRQEATRGAFFANLRKGEPRDV